jgi:hypothetical protein
MLKNQIEHDKILIDFVSGMSAGFAAGIIVAPAEYIKVLLQTTVRKEFNKMLTSSQTYKNMMRSVLPFSFIFSNVCAVEFSVNRRLEEDYGRAVGVVASASTGAIFLTAADHLMFRRQKSGESILLTLSKLFKINNRVLWTGFVPMLGREAIFITSVMHLGPWVGKKLQEDNRESLFWNSVGRFATGAITTIISQPFDVLARRMQLKLYQAPNEKPSIIACLKKAQEEFSCNHQKQSIMKHPLLCGAIPRTGLATTGGVLAGGFFDYFRNKLVSKNNLIGESNITEKDFPSPK